MNYENWLGDGSDISDDSSENNESFKSVSTDANETSYGLEFTGRNSKKTSTKYSKLIIRDAGSVLETPKHRKSKASSRNLTEQSTTSGVVDDEGLLETPKSTRPTKKTPNNEGDEIPRINKSNKSKEKPPKKASRKSQAAKEVTHEAESSSPSKSSESSRTSESHNSTPASPNTTPVPKDSIRSGKLQSHKQIVESKKKQRKQTNPQKANQKSNNVLKDMVKLQATTRKFPNFLRFHQLIKHSFAENLIPKLCFSRLVKEVMQDVSRGEVYRVTPEFLMALQESSELYLTHFFSDAYLCTIHRGRITLIPKDMQLALRMRGITDPGV